MTDHRILKLTHHAPYDGCFYERNLFLLDMEYGQVFGLQAIYAPTEDRKPSYHHLSLEEAQRHYDDWLNGTELGRDFPFDEPQVFEFDDKLHEDIPTNLIPTVYAFFNGGYDDNPVRDLGRPFMWACDHCGELTDSYPSQDTGYSGNGGVGLNFDGWVCEDHDGEYNYQQSVLWTQEVLRISFSSFFEENEAPEDMVHKIIAWMDDNERGFDSNETGGGYPKDEQVKRALEDLGYRDLEEEVE